jgi:16S rRNA (cytidine1402-2'-O)-methyltransferase
MSAWLPIILQGDLGRSQLNGTILGSRTMGTLFLVATPIGNLEDVTLRALRVLKEVALIAAEDTRRTATLLHHYAITTPTTSLHEYNEKQKTASLVARLSSGDSIALVSDAGTPGVSDPGFRLVRAALAGGIRVEAVPGPSAVLAALVASGLPADTFTFLGFPPSKAKARDAWLGKLAEEPRTVVFFEAPHRVRATLQAAARVLEDREIALGRELTKLHEQWIRGPARSVFERLDQPRGEITIVVAPAPRDAPPARPPDKTLWEGLEELAGQEGVTRRAAILVLAARYKMSAREVYTAVERAKKEAKQEASPADRLTSG